MKLGIKNYFSKTIEEFGFKDKKTLFLILRCVGIVALQILSLVIKELAFVELVYVIFLIIWDKPKQNKLAYLFFLLPFYNVFRYGTGNVQFYNIFDSFKNMYFSIWALLVFDVVLFVLWCVALHKKEKKVDIKKYIIWLALLVVFLLPFTNSESLSVSNGIVVVALFATLFLLTQFKEEFDVAGLLKFWFFGLIFSVLVFCLKFALPNLQDYLVVFETRFSCLMRDPNYLSFEILVMMCGFTTLLLKKKSQHIYPIIILTLTIIAFFALSKSFMVSFFVLLCVLLVYLIMFLKKNKEWVKNNKRVIIAIVSMVMIVVGVLLAIFAGEILTLVKRFLGIYDGVKSNQSLIDRITTGRWSIWCKYLKDIFSSFVSVVLGRSVLYGYKFGAVHNTPLQLFYFGGILGIALLLWAVIKSLLKNKNNISWYAVIPFVAIFVMSCSLDMLFSFRTAFVLFILILSMEKGEENAKSISSDECL